MATDPFRVLIVDDFKPWRRFASTTLLKQSKLQVIGEVSDGLEAVQQAELLQPDLILLDIGLPTLNGIEAARRIRNVSPTSKILFVSECRSVDIAEGALNTGAGGYVVKSDAGRELLLAVDTVLKGEGFLSASLDGDANVQLNTQTAEKRGGLAHPLSHHKNVRTTLRGARRVGNTDLDSGVKIDAEI